MTVFLLFCVFLGLLLAAAYYAYRIAFYNSYKNRDQKPNVVGAQYDAFRPRMREIYHNLKHRPCEIVTVEFSDGLTLSGRYYHTADGAPLDLCFHGYRSTPMTDFSGGAELSFAMGHNLLLVDQRAHGASRGRTITFGIKERQDVLVFRGLRRFRQHLMPLHLSDDGQGIDVPCLCGAQLRHGVGFLLFVSFHS